MNTANELRNEMRQQMARIDQMDAAACIDYMSGLYDHDLTEASALDELRAEARRQCRRDYEQCLTESERADWRFIDALCQRARRT